VPPSDQDPSCCERWSLQRDRIYAPYGLFTHFRFRGKTDSAEDEPIPNADAPGPAAGKTLYLRDTDFWARRFYVKSSPREAERRLFR
jgi:hypothetical protein